MNPLSAPVPGETLAEAGERIRAACPILGATATNEECHTRRELITDTLDARGVRPGPHTWHTAQLLDGHVVGVFADSPEEAEIDLTVWWGRRCHWVIPDPQCQVLHEYVPASNRGATAGAPRFPVGPPRRPRDQFAPTPSLLDGIFPEPGIGR